MAGEIHVLAIPFPAQGHIVPLVNFTKLLASKGMKITLAFPTSHINCKAVSQLHGTSSFKIEYICDGLGSCEPSMVAAKFGGSTEACFNTLKEEHSKNLSKLMEKLGKSNQPPNVVLCDSTIPWALEIAHQNGLPSATFFAIYCGFNCIYYHVFKGSLKLSSEDQSVKSIPPLPPLEFQDLPCHPSVGRFDEHIDKLYANQFLNIEKADWILFNTFDKLESEVASWMGRQFPIKTVGPVTNLKDEKLNGIDDHHHVQKNSDSIIKWLENREKRSVVYVSFGSQVVLGEEQMKEIARGLENSNCYFLWVIRTDEKSKLPPNFKSKTSNKGLILEWCSQREVLAHQAVACFISHCGWNSTLESLSSGVPLIAMPCLVDQTTNAKFISDVWKAGVRAKSNNKGIFTGEEIEIRIREVTQSERGKELKQNALRWKQEIEKATAPGGTSYKNIEDFVSELLMKI